MAVLHVIDRDGSERSVEADTGYSVMEVLRDRDFDIAAICGGCCSCATCHVFIAPEWKDKLEPLEGDEFVLVESTQAYREGESRLSCQIQFTEALDGLRLTLAPHE